MIQISISSERLHHTLFLSLNFIFALRDDFALSKFPLHIPVLFHAVNNNITLIVRIEAWNMHEIIIIIMHNRWIIHSFFIIQDRLKDFIFNLDHLQCLLGCFLIAGSH